MPVRALGERGSYKADDGVGFDGQGYVLTSGDEGGDTVKKAVNDDTIVGVNYRSTFNLDDSAVETGVQIATQQDGYVNVLCAAGANYELGDAVYLSTTPGVCDTNIDTDGDTVDDTFVGRVVTSMDLTAADGPELVPVKLTGVLR